MNAHTLRAELHGDDAAHPHAPADDARVTERYRQSHRLAREGHSTRAIASEVGVARDTVRKYLHNRRAVVDDPCPAMRYDHAREEWVVDDGGER